MILTVRNGRCIECKLDLEHKTMHYKGFRLEFDNTKEGFLEGIKRHLSDTFNNAIGIPDKFSVKHNNKRYLGLENILALVNELVEA